MHRKLEMQLLKNYLSQIVHNQPIQHSNFNVVIGSNNFQIDFFIK